MCVCVSCVWGHTYMCVYGRERIVSVAFLSHDPPGLGRQGLSLAWSSSRTHRFAGQQAPGSRVSSVAGIVIISVCRDARVSYGLWALDVNPRADVALLH